MHKALGSVPSPHEYIITALGIQELGGSGIQVSLYSDFKTNLGYVRPCLKKGKEKKASKSVFLPVRSPNKGA